MSVILHIPCAHETKGLPTNRTVPDYHPLTLDQVQELLAIAATALKAKEWKTANRVQIRLCQAVLDSVCPHNIDDENWRQRTNEVSALYLDWYRAGCSTGNQQSVAKRIFEAFTRPRTVGSEQSTGPERARSKYNMRNDPDILRTPNPQCPACLAQRIHTDPERAQFHPDAGHGFTKEHGWTKPGLEKTR